MGTDVRSGGSSGTVTATSKSKTKKAVPTPSTELRAPQQQQVTITPAGPIQYGPPTAVKIPTPAAAAIAPPKTPAPPQNGPRLTPVKSTPTTPTAQKNKVVKNTVQKSAPTAPAAAAPVTTAPAETAPAAPEPDPFSTAYQPVMDYLKTQAAQLQDRYGKNASDISSIFGTLSTVRAADKAKINEQFTQSIQQQQDALAKRTAAAQLGMEQGIQGAATAAAESGSGGMPVPTDSLSAQAANQGIADSNAYATTWQGLQSVMNQQEQANVQNAISGYGFQQVNATEQNAKNLQDALSGNAGNQAQLLSQIAQSRLGAQAAGVQAQNDISLQQLKNQGTTEAARLRAAGTVSAAQLRAAGSVNAAGLRAAKTTAVDPNAPSKSIADWSAKVSAATGDKNTGNDVRQLVGDLVTRIQQQRAKKADPSTGKTTLPANVKVSKQDIMRAWTNNYPNSPVSDLVQEYLNKYY